ncbi:MAG: NAD-dependent epimerase/dehydratase family protein [Geodermatophilaceae bacterium]|nr:NAD-dependent epimerase/dehydratase family protein [Geodermatophilaceae bacterium]
MRILLTGAAGFIGGTVWGTLEARGHEVVALDALIPQAHGTTSGKGADERIHRVDVRDAAGLRGLLTGVDVVCHQAAMVGAGVTPADLPLFAGHNDLGTAVLLAEMSSSGIDKIVFASSMVVYGDGRYVCPEHGDQPATARSIEALEAGRFEVGCPVCGTAMGWALVDEDARLLPRSSYAASKVAQEHYASAWARQLPGSAIGLRYHNVYGPHMPADTPYSGVAAMFRSALARGEALRVYEDGQQTRDFVHVDDVALVNALAVERVVALAPDTFTAYNVCSGEPVTIARVAQLIAAATGEERLEPTVTGQYRSGDVRHIVASPQRAREELGFTATVAPPDGLAAFAEAPLRDR